MDIKTFYFTNPDRPERIAKIVTELPVERLKEMGVIDKDANVMERNETNEKQFPSIEDEGKYFDCLKFNKKKNPTKVVVDINQAKSEWYEEVIQERNECLGTTDFFMLKAIGMQNKKFQEVVEKDKEVLRDMPVKIDLSKIKTIKDLEKLVPPSLDIDYEHKYKSYIVEHRAYQKANSK